MLRRWGFVAFFLLALLLAAGAWVGSYRRYVAVFHYSIDSGLQEVFVGVGSMYVFVSDAWIAYTWVFQNDRVNPVLAAAYEELYQNAPYRFLRSAFNAEARSFTGGSRRMLIIPLWFPTTLSALGLLWAWRRKRRLDRTRRGGFEVQPPELEAKA